MELAGPPVGHVDQQAEYSLGKKSPRLDLAHSAVAEQLTGTGRGVLSLVSAASILAPLSCLASHLNLRLAPRPGGKREKASSCLRHWHWHWSIPFPPGPSLTSFSLFPSTTNRFSTWPHQRFVWAWRGVRSPRSRASLSISLPPCLLLIDLANRFLAARHSCFRIIIFHLVPPAPTTP
jgi:hypothetical protein